MGAEAIAIVVNMLAYSKNVKAVRKLIFDFLTEITELRTGPLKFMIGMSHLSFSKVEKYVEILVGSSHDHMLGIYLSEDSLAKTRQIFYLNVLDHFNHSYHFDATFSFWRNFLHDIQVVKPYLEGVFPVEGDRLLDGLWGYFYFCVVESFEVKIYPNEELDFFLS